MEDFIFRKYYILKSTKCSILQFTVFINQSSNTLINQIYSNYLKYTSIYFNILFIYIDKLSYICINNFKEEFEYYF